MTNISTELKERDIVHQVAGGKLEDILETKRTFYFGIDPSADSLHLGNLAGLMLARRLVRAGHKAIILIGGATGQIGDPSGKQAERVLQDKKDIARNAKAQGKQVQNLLGTKDFKLVNNADWLEKVSLLDFLRDTGKHFTVNALIKRDLIRDRLKTEENSISYTEFTYALLQAYDFYHLNTTKGCDLQISGSDQWGNIVAGIDLIRKKNSTEAYGITIPLITDETGKKFGKTEGNAVWLDKEKTSPFAFYQFWVNQSDAQLEMLMKIFTDIPVEEIKNLLSNESLKTREGQKRLAFEVTELVHGTREAEAAAEASEVLFSGNMKGLSAKIRSLLLRHAPNTATALETSLVDVLVSTGLAQSKREARDFINNGSVRINNQKVEDAETKLTPEHFIDDLALLKKGKRDVHVLVLK